ncbi:MAG: hypothetical protein U0793_10765 [Gemmataceae bacterium]
MELPLCQFRMPAESGLQLCSSPLLKINGPFPADLCGACPAPDRAHGEVVPGPRLPCLYRGNPADAGANGAPRHEERHALEAHSCGKHGLCTPLTPAPGTRCCATCPDYKPRSGAPGAAENSVATMTRLLRGPRRDWPPDWPYWGTALEAHRQLAAEFARALPPYPEEKYAGRGIVILGGGAFFAGVYVAVRMIRHFGCRLPIEVWHHAPTEPVVETWLRPFNVRCRDLDEHMERVAPSRLKGGWTSKFYAVLHSSFEEVFYMDSDCYPVGDLTTLFDDDHSGTVLWPDFWSADGHLRRHVYNATPTGSPPLSGGQFLIDKRRRWSELQLAQWWNERADYSYRHGFGDQDVLRGVLEQRHTPITFYERQPRWDRVAFLFCGPDGRTPLLVHRCDDKFRLPLAALKCHVPGADKLYLGQVRTAETTYQPGLPGEDLAFSYFREFKRRWFDHEPARFRPGRDDAWLWEEVVYQNIYRLPDTLPAGALVVAVGDEIGAFAHAACRHGAAEVLLFEDDPEIPRRNLRYWGERVAVVAGERLPDSTRPVHLLKLSCGRRLWRLLTDARDLSFCRNIIGDYELRDETDRARDLAELCALLGRHGFKVRTQPLSDQRGRFFAMTP